MTQSNLEYKSNEPNKYMQNSVERTLKTWFAKNEEKFGKIQSLAPLPGDASSRRYFRARKKNTSYIIMKMEPYSDLNERLPFVQVQQHLNNLKINVPKILALDPQKGIIVLSDLGDETLLKQLESVSTKHDQALWFKKSIDLLLKMQVSATKNTAAIDAYGLYFDEEKLMWEISYTLAHFYGGSLARKVPNRDYREIQTYFHGVCKELAAQEWYFTHRDFHSRNIMVTTSKNSKKELFMVDFQDARLGCAQYDLASLLRDSYYQLEEDTVYDLVEYYIKEKEKLEKRKINKKDFIRVFDLMSIQRNFKAIGSFASFYTKRNDVRYLKFIGNTFENIRRNLLKFPELDELRYLLFRYYYF